MTRGQVRSARALMLACLAGALVAANGCLLFTSIDDLGGQTRPSGDASDEGAVVGLDGSPDQLDGARGDATLDAPGSFGSAVVLARTAPGLRGIGIDDTRVYFTNDDTSEVRWASKTGAGGAASTLLSLGKKPTDLAVDATRVYWIQNEGTSDLNSSYVFRSIRKDGTDYLNGGGNYLFSVRMTMTGSQVFTSTFTASSQWILMRDGTAMLGAAKPGAAKCILSDGVTVFYESAGVIRTYPDPDAGVPFATAEATDLAVDETSPYWITTDGLVQKLDKSKRGEKPVTLATALSATARIAIDDQSVYVTAWGLGAATGKVVRVPKSGGPAVAVATGLHEPWGIAVDATGVYVTNHGDGTVVALPRQ